MTRRPVLTPSPALVADGGAEVAPDFGDLGLGQAVDDQFLGADAPAGGGDAAEGAGVGPGSGQADGQPLAVDGHPVPGTFGFTTTQRATGTPPTRAAAPPEAASPSASWRPVLLTAVGLTAAGVFTAGLLSRRGRRRLS